MKRFALAGNPISHSLSPRLFKAAYPGADMSYDLLETSAVEEAVEIFRKEYDAINVTSPFKESAFAFADSCDPVTETLRCTNLLMKKSGGIFASNTDFWAVSNILRPLRLDLGNPGVLVIGCGGAGKAAALAAADLHMTVFLANRTFGKAQEFASRIGGITPIELRQTSDVVGSGKAGIIIYAVPEMIEGIRELPLEGLTVIEANYRTPHLKDICCNSGARYVPGEEWLVLQAVTGFTMMTGTTPDEQAMRNCSHIR